MRIWAYHPSLKPAIDALHDFGVNPMRDLYHHQHGPDSYRQYWRRTLVAEDDDQVIGVATLAESLALTTWDFAFIEVAPEHRRQGVGLALFDAISGLRGRPMESMVWDLEPGGVEFAERLAGRVLARCPLPDADLAAPETAGWIDDHPSDGLRFADVAGMPDRKIRAVFARMWWSGGTWHQTKRGGLDTQIAGLIRYVDRQSSVLTTRDDQVVAAGFALFSPDESATIHAQTVSPEEPDGEPIVAATVAEVLRRLGKARAKRASVQGHLAEPNIDPVLTSLPAVETFPGRHIEFQPSRCRAKAKWWRPRPSEHRERLILRS